MTALKRIYIYCKEMYPILPRLALGYVLFFEIYFLVLLTNGGDKPRIGAGEFVGGFTLFVFLLSLRIADDLKDYETDKKLFSTRPLPSGRVKKKDVVVLLCLADGIAVVLNITFMNNLLFFVILVCYGTLMSLWFFQKAKIQPNLPLALITHNPVQIVMNFYVISFACKCYGIPLLTVNNIVIAFTLYFPGLIWEIARKIRAPEQETEYTTYSKLFGYKKATKFILVVMLVDLFTSSYLAWQLYPWAVIPVLGSYLWLMNRCFVFMRDPSRFSLVGKIERYEYLAEGSMVATIGLYLFGFLR